MSDRQCWFLVAGFCTSLGRFVLAVIVYAAGVAVIDSVVVCSDLPVSQMKRPHYNRVASVKFDSVLIGRNGKISIGDCKSIVERIPVLSKWAMREPRTFDRVTEMSTNDNTKMSIRFKLIEGDLQQSSAVRGY